MKDKSSKPGPKREPENPRLAVVRRLRAMANLFRTQAKITEEAEEALRWEKLADQREAEINSGQLANAA